MPEPSVSSADRDRAVDALERAVFAAERGVADRPVVVVSASDLAAVPRENVRTCLDRVMMGDHPDEGLDALLVTGVLDRLLP